MECHKNSNSATINILNSEKKEKPSKKQPHRKRKSMHKNNSMTTMNTENKCSSEQTTAEKKCIRSQKTETKKNFKSQPYKSEEMRRSCQSKTGKKYTHHKTNINCTDKHISQEIYVEKQEFQCIINLNTTVCKHKSNNEKKCVKKHRSKHLKSPDKCDVNTVDRIVPQCFRQDCCPKLTQLHENKTQKETYERNDIKSHHKERDITTLKVGVKHGNRRKLKHAHHNICIHGKKRPTSRNSRELLSSISSASLPNDIYHNLVYDDISTASLEVENSSASDCIEIETIVETPASYKTKVKIPDHRDDGKVSKLDTLIKRTKERERKLVAESRSNIDQWLTSTPVHSDFSTGDFPDFPMTNSDMDISITSRSTLVLDVMNGSSAYSPSAPIEDLETADEKSVQRAYSPSSPIKCEDYLKELKFSDNNAFKLEDIKNEPTMDIEAYSPKYTSDDLTAKLFEKCVEKERKIKTESLFSPGISPIYFEKDNPGLFCILNNVKSEINHE